MTTEPPFSLEEVYSKLYEGIEYLDHGDSSALKALSEIEKEVPRWLKQHLELEHTTPSPSGVMECFLKQFFQAKGFEPDQASPIGWKIRRALGVISEPYFLAALQAGGFEIGLPDVAYPCGEHMIAHPDATINNDFLCEIKNISGFGYRKLLESFNGVQEVEIGHYMQCQLYMYGANKNFCLYLASPADFSLLQSNMRGRKKYGQDYEMKPIYLEWIERDEDAIQLGLDRGIMINRDIESNTAPLREHSGLKLRPNGTRNWPCSWCLFLGHCNEVNVPERAAGIRFVS